MSWVRLCGLHEGPEDDCVTELSLNGKELCLAKVAGEFRVLDNICPHRLGPLGQGWIEGNVVVCPWHSWTFDTQTGQCEYPGGVESVAVFPARIESDTIYVDIVEAET